MDLSLLPTPAGEFNRQRTGALFTVRSANSPSYNLTRRPGVRKPRGFSEEGRESAEEVGERLSYGTQTGANGSIKVEDHSATGYQARSGSSSSLIGQCGEDTLGHKMSSRLSQNGTADKTITEFGTDRGGNTLFESRGRTELRRYNVPNRSKSLDWRTGERNLERGRRPDMLISSRLWDVSKLSGGLEERTRLEGTKGRLRSSIQAYYNSPGTSNVVQERNPVSHISQTLDRTSKGHSLPSRIRSQSGPCSIVRVTPATFGPKGGQSILERIEKLYGSAGVGQTEDFSKIRDSSTPVTPHHQDFLIPPQTRSYDSAAGGTFPRRFTSGQTSSLSQVQGRNSFSWTQKDSSSETSLSPSRARERVSGGQWQGQIQGVNLSRGLGDTGTMSLDRARSRNTGAARIRAARAAEGISTPPQSNALFDVKRSISWRDSPGLRERRLSGSTDWGRVNHGKEKGETNINGTFRERTGWLELQGTDDGPKEKVKLKSISTDDVFESNPQKITMKTMERKKISEGSSVQSAASVRNKINQFEALTQRSHGLATGQVLMQRRAYSVPTQLGGANDGVKKSGSAKAIGGLRDKWEELKEGGEKPEAKVTAGKKLGSERSLSVDEVGLRLERKEREEREQTDSGNNCAEDFGKYARLKSTLEIPINGGTQTQRRNFYIDETDFSKVSSPEEPKEHPTSLLLTDTSTGVQKTTTIATSTASDEDKTPTNTPNQSPFLSPTTQPQHVSPDAASENEITSVLTQDAEIPEPVTPPPAPTTSSHSTPVDLVSPDVNAAYPKGKKQVLDLDAWVAGLNPKINVWDDDDDDYEDDDESTQKDEDSNYDSDSGESSVTITSNMSQSDRRSFCVSLSDLCNFAGVDYESENDSDEWPSTGRRSASLSSDMSAFSHVSVLPTEELDKLLEDVRSLGDSTLQDYNDVQVVVLHKEVGVGLGFSLAGGTDQNKPVTVHKVFHLGVAAKEGSIREGDQVLSINGTALRGFPHWEALRVLRRAKTRDLGVVVLRRGAISSVSKRGAQTKNPVPTETQATETGECVCVRLEKNSRDLGFSLEGGVGSGQENRPLTVQKIFQGGPVDKVRPGDEVVEIESVSMVGMRRLEAWTLIRRLPSGPVDVVLRRPL